MFFTNLILTIPPPTGKQLRRCRKQVPVLLLVRFWQHLLELGLPAEVLRSSPFPFNQHDEDSPRFSYTELRLLVRLLG
jgi:hypothetical protein